MCYVNILKYIYETPMHEIFTFQVLTISTNFILTWSHYFLKNKDILVIIFFLLKGSSEEK